MMPAHPQPWWHRKPAMLIGMGVTAVAIASAAWACADSSCGPNWRLGSPAHECAGRPALSPGNDSRINLLLLMRSVRPLGDKPATYPKADWDSHRLGHSFLTWPQLRALLWPKPEPRPEAPADTPAAICEASASGQPAFASALAAEPALPASDRAALVPMRARLGCRPLGTDPALASATGREYLAYLKAAEAFYAGNWPAARQGFAALAHAHSPWISQTASYMPIRIALNAAVAPAMGQYGDFAGLDKVDTKAASAKGLIRRALWLGGHTEDLARSYEQALVATPADDEALADLIEEIDVSLLRGTSAAAIAKAGHVPHVLAIADLLQMRIVDPDKPFALTATDLAAQQPQFAQHPDLYSFLAASRSWYAGQDPQTVLAMIPDASHTASFTPLAFSRQTIRGMALAKAKDPGEAAFWQALMAGADPLYQRPFAELGLALRWQHENRLDLVFAPGSPIGDATIREILLQNMAAPAILRTDAQNTARPAHERDIARFTLLYKDLSKGAYGDFVRDVALVPADANVDANLWAFPEQEILPLGLFTKGKWQDDFACPPLAQTAATLAASPANRRALLCLGDFWRLNGFDGFSLFRAAPDFGSEPTADLLGFGHDGFPGSRLPRDAIYTAIIADHRALPEERAYALYRAVMCYAPSGYNGCAGPFQNAQDMDKAQASKTQRRAWFDELKKSYPTSPWAKTLRYYW